MSKRLFIKNNQVIAEAAIRSGVRYFFGYPITPQNEIVEYMALRLPEVGGVFLQPESELSGINMVAGCSSGGKFPMISTSGPGISLMSEGLSFLACAQLPCLVVNIMRVGPGDGDIRGTQGDYFQATKGGGHGDYHLIVIAPSSGQEIVVEVGHAIKLANHYRCPVLLLIDGLLAQMSEPVMFPRSKDRTLCEKPWALTGSSGRKRNVIRTYFNNVEDALSQNLHLQRIYREIQSKEQKWEEVEVEDAELILVGFGIIGRIARSVIEEARRKGLKIGLIRPLTLWPFPEDAFLKLPASLRSILVVEENAGQMVEDVKLSVHGRTPVRFSGKLGGQVPTVTELLRLSEKLIRRGCD